MSEPDFSANIRYIYQKKHAYTATIIEMGLYFLFFIAYIASLYLRPTMISETIQERILFVILNPTTAVLSVFMFFSILLTILLGASPLTYIVYNFRTIFSPDVGQVNLSDSKEDSDLSKNIEEVVEVSSAEAYFIKYIDRSSSTSLSARRQPTALLFVGATIAIFGLLFFIYTLPDFIGNPLLVNLPYSVYIWYVIPRILMLLFIQVLAGFFLRQYRASMEEFRYYEGILRMRENYIICYKIFQEVNNIEGTRILTEIMLSQPDLGRMNSSESSMVLKATQIEANESVTAIDILTKSLSQLASVLHGPSLETKASLQKGRRTKPPTS